MATSPAIEKALRDRFGQILMSAACQKIDFWWLTHINGSAFCFTALALASALPNGIRCNVGGVRAGAGATYKKAPNTINVPSATFGSTDAWEKSAVVHEATHAVFDEQKPGTTRGVLEETAAFVAGALFNIYSAPALSGPYPFNPTGLGIWEIAHTVAMSIAATPGYALNPTVASPLRLAI